MRYEVTERSLVYVYTTHTIEVEAKDRDEAFDIAGELIYDKLHAAIDPIGSLDEVDTYEYSIKEIEE